jgi:hypothetical protein
VTRVVSLQQHHQHLYSIWIICNSCGSLNTLANTQEISAKVPGGADSK